MASRRKRTRLASLVVLGVAVTGGYALTSGFTATNTVSTQDVGAGTAAASPYTASGIVYQLGTTDITKVGSVAFDLNKAADNVKVTITNGGTIYNCVLTGTPTIDGIAYDGTAAPNQPVPSATHPVCDLSQVANSVIDNLTVAATIKSA
jgi:hypothetical protein